MSQVFVATSNPGKLRDFSTVAAPHRIAISPLPEFSSLLAVTEDAPSFEANARKKAEHYSRYVPGALVLPDDSGLEVEALDRAPGVRYARYATKGELPNASDAANNARLLAELEEIPEERRLARFVCVIAVARDGQTLGTCGGEAQGTSLRSPRGLGGFGYDPLFFLPALGKTFAELSPEEKATVSHRGRAFRNFLTWYETWSASTT